MCEEKEKGGKELEEEGEAEKVVDYLFIITIYLCKSVFLCLIFFLNPYLLST